MSDKTRKPLRWSNALTPLEAVKRGMLYVDETIDALQRADWHMTRAAALLNIPPEQMYDRCRRMRRYGILTDPPGKSVHRGRPPVQHVKIFAYVAQETEAAVRAEAARRDCTIGQVLTDALRLAGIVKTKAGA